jgi:hypothetical protein
MLQPFVRTLFLGCEGETVLVDVDADGRRAHVLPSYTSSHITELYAKKVEMARAFGAATTVPKSMTREVLRRGNRRGRRNPSLDP